MKKLLKNNSIYMLFVVLSESILSIVCTLSFVYSDSLNYNSSIVFENIGVSKLLESMYTSTWWALLLLLLAMCAIFSLTALVFKKMEFQFISICIWFIMMILSLNLTLPIKELITRLVLFIPIIGISIIAYYSQKKKEIN